MLLSKHHLWSLEECDYPCSAFPVDDHARNICGNLLVLSARHTQKALHVKVDRSLMSTRSWLSESIYTASKKDTKPR